MTARATIFVVALLVAFDTVAAEENDPVEAKLVDAKAQYEKSSEKVRTAVLEALGKKDASSKRAGDLKGLEAVQAEILAFEKTGTMPRSIAIKSFDGQLKLARAKMEEAFKDAIKRYTKDGKIELAKVVQQELDEFKAGTSANDPFSPKSVWVGDGGKVLTVIERRGDTFLANFKVGPGIEREVSGSIKKEKLSWLAKQVRPIKGNAGGDNHGTIVAEKDSYKIDFVWQGDNGATGNFTLRLTKPNES